MQFKASKHTTAVEKKGDSSLLLLAYSVEFQREFAQF